ncbi:MAG: hypothetical protein V1756_02245 [Patescibacteria group bacterium]
MMQNVKSFIKGTPLYGPLSKILDKIELHRWKNGGKCGHPPHLLKQETVKEYARRFGIKSFVETGTYMGKMVEAVKNDFQEIFSVELDENLFEDAKKKFIRYPHIHIIHGDSGKVLSEMLNSIQEPCLFWLDAHYSGGITAKGDIETPIEDELRAIFTHSIPGHVILIDDACDFIGKDDYPTIEQLKNRVSNYRSELIFEIKDNIIRIHPPGF